MTILTPQSWQEFISEASAFVLFHSPYSAYSRRTVATLTEIEPQFPSLKFGLADVDGHDFAAVTSRYAIAGLPTAILIRSNEQAVTFLGERTAKSWVKLLENWLPIPTVTKPSA